MKQEALSKNAAVAKRIQNLKTSDQKDQSSLDSLSKSLKASNQKDESSLDSLSKSLKASNQKDQS